MCARWWLLQDNNTNTNLLEIHILASLQMVTFSCHVFSSMRLTLHVNGGLCAQSWTVFWELHSQPSDLQKSW